MPQNSVSDWDTTAGGNTDVGGVNIDEGMSPGDVNNALREVMAQIKAFSTAVLPPGSVQAYAGLSAPAGWLLLNGATLGSAASTGTNKSDDYQTLYELIWNNFADAQAPVTGGRGASANADWVANKTISMPNATGRVIAGREPASNLLTSAIAGFEGVTLGAAGGDQRAQSHTHSATIQVVHTNGGAVSGPVGATTSNALGFTTGNPNGSKHGGNSGNVQPTIVLTLIIKY